MPLEWHDIPPIVELRPEHVASVAKAFADRLNWFAAVEGAAWNDHRDARAASPALAAARDAGVERKARSAGSMIDLIEMEFSRPTPPAGARVFAYSLTGRVSGVARMIQVTPDGAWLKIDYLGAHPLAENAGDILIEYVLRFAPADPPKMTLLPVSSEATDRYAELGFVSVSPLRMDLDLGATASVPYWVRVAGVWKRTKYWRARYAANLSFQTTG